MVAATSIADLPEELLLQIFALLSVHDLLWAAQRVCRSWKSVAGAPVLWKRRSLEVTDDVDDRALLAFARRAPYLGKLSLRRPVPEDVLEAVARHCRRLSSLEIFCVAAPPRALDGFARRCPGIRHLGLPAAMLADASVTATCCQMRSLRSLRVTVEKPGGVRPRLEVLADGDCPPRLEGLRLEMSRFQCEDLDRLLHQKRNSMRTLSLTLFPGSSLPPALLECRVLQELVVYCPPRTYPSRGDLLGVVESLRALVVLHLEGPEYSRSEIAVSDCDDDALWTLFEFGGGSNDDDVAKPSPVVDDAFLAAVCRGCPLLEDLVLGLRGRTRLTDAGLRGLAQLTRLRKLGLRFCPPPLSAPAVVAAAPRGLTHLDLTAFADLRGRLPWTEFPLLRSLVLDCCDVSEVPLEALRRGGQLRLLSLEFCEGVDAEALARLRKAAPELVVVYDEGIA